MRSLTVRRGVPIAAVAAVLLAVLPAVSASAVTPSPWPEFGNGPSHTGTSTGAQAITAANVSQLTQAFSATLPGVADGPPVFQPSVVTSEGTIDMLFVATKDGWIAGLDAHTGTTVWAHQNGPGSCHINNGGSICYTTSSPALDPNGQYVYAYGLDGRAHKYAVATGVETTTGGWPELATAKPYDEKGSSALAVATSGGVSYLYVANGGYPGDRGDYQGHVTTINLATGAQKVFNTLCSDKTIHFTAAAATDCSNVQSAVWARVGVTVDSDTGKVYMTTGNSVFDGQHNWGDSVLAINPDGSGTATGPVDSYTPTNQSQLNQADADLGSTTIAVVTAPSGSSVTHLGVQGGKDQKLRLLNLDDLSGQGGPGHTGGELQLMNVPQGGLVFTHPASWVNPADSTSWVFVATGNGISGLRLSAPGGVPTMTTQWTVNSGGTSPILSNGVLYYLTGNGVRALNPTTGAVLWSDSSGGVGLHWQSPIVAGGSLYYADGGGHLRAFHLPGGITRISGNDRYDVSAAVSSSLAAGVPVAYVASGANYPDALSGSAVAGRDGGPMLLVQPDAIPASIATELNRLHPGKIIVLGGTASVSDAVFSALHGYTTGTVSRIAGADRYVVSAAISDSYAPGIGVAYVTTGENFPDALSATPLAAGTGGGPILLTAHDVIPSSVATALQRLHPGRIVIVGGPASVNPSVATQLQAFTTGSVTRLDGEDRFAASAAVAGTFTAPVGTVYLTLGMNFPDALSAGPSAGRAGAPILLVFATSIPTATSAALQRLAPTNIVIVGGTASVSSAIQQSLASYLG